MSVIILMLFLHYSHYGMVFPWWMWFFAGLAAANETDR